METTMKNKKVQIGIIGAGGISQMVHIPGFQRCKNAEVLAVCDESEDMRKNAVKQFGIKTTYGDYSQMLENPDIDAVCIATPNYLHYPIVMEAIRHKKHILCEKPLALKVKEAAQMAEKAKKAGLVTMVAYNYRYVPAIRFLRMLIDQGKLGSIRHIRAFYLQQWTGNGASWRTRKKFTGSGELGDVGSHLIDFARFLVGEIDWVFGHAPVIVKERIDPITKKSERPDVDDAAAFLAHFKSGATGVFEVTRCAPGRGCGINEHQSMEINGEKGSVIYDYRNPAQLLLSLTPKDQAATRFVPTPIPAAVKKFYGPAIWKAFLANPPVGFRFKQAEEFVNAVQYKKPVTPSFLDGLKTQQILDAILQADKNKRVVKL
jgi:predicted dehydrogenase